jgi:hypothetical protein
MLGRMTTDRGIIDDWRLRRYALRDDVTVTDLGDQLVLLDPSNQEMYALDAVGRFILEALPTAPLGAVADTLSARYDLDPATAGADLRDLIAELVEAGLVREPPPRPSGP